MISVDFTKKFFIVITCVLLLIGCEKFLPGAYQEEEFAISALDDKACECLNDSLSDSVYTSGLTNFDTTWVGSAIYENVEVILDSLEANEIKIIDTDTSFTIITPEEVDSNYVFLSAGSNELVFFFSDYVDMNILETDGTVLEAESKAISLETIYYGISPDTTYQDTVVTDIIDCSKLKTRILYELSENKDYLMQIIRSDQTLNNTFRLVVLPNL
jgi:hypothetical protein